MEVNALYIQKTRKNSIMDTFTNQADMQGKTMWEVGYVGLLWEADLFANVEHGRYAYMYVFDQVV
jgi:hypothetical protein